MSLLSILNPEMGEQFPGMYGQPRQGGGMPFEGMLGGMSPLLGMLGSAFQLDKNVMQMIMGPGMTRYGGSFDTATNQSNIFMNQWQTALNQRTLSDVTPKANEYQVSMLKGMYSKMGFSDATSLAKAQNASDSYFNPMGLIAGEMMGAHQFEKARIEMQRTSMALGLQDTTALISSYGGMTNDELRRMGYPNSAAITNAQDSRVRGAKRLNDEFMNQYTKDPFAFGGLNAGESGQVMSWMSKNGGINPADLVKYEDTRDREGNIVNAGAQKTVGKIKEMSSAVSVMQEIFGGSIPELLQKMDAMFSGQAGAMDPATIKNRMLQFKHTAAVTGMSIENLQNMMGAGQQYLGALGADQSMGFGVALGAAQLIGSNTGSSGNRVNADQYRSDILKMTAGAAGSERATQGTAAYLLWLEKQKGASDTSANRSAFEELVKQNGGDLGGLAVASGVSANTIQIFGESERVKNFQQDNPMFGAKMALGDKIREVAAVRSFGLRQAFERVGMSISDADASSMDQKSLVDRVNSSKLSLEQKRELEGSIGLTFTQTGEMMDFKGARAGASMDELMKNWEESSKNTGLINARANMDASFKDRFQGRFGFRGIMEAIKNDKDLSASSVMGSAFGLAKGEKIEANKLSEALGRLSEQKKNSPEGKLLDKMDMSIMDSLRNGATLSKEDNQLAQDIMTGKYKNDADLLNKMTTFYEDTNEEGKRMKVMEKMGLKEAFLNESTDEGRKKIAKQAQIKKSLQDTLIKKTYAADDIEKKNPLSVDTREYDKALEKAGGSLDKALENAVRDKNSDINKAMKENEKLLGLDSGPLDLNTILQSLVTAIEGLTNMTSGKTGEPKTK